MSLVAGIRVCKRGHVQTPENVDVAADGKRRCRPCGQWRSSQRKHTAKVPCPLCGRPKWRASLTCQSCRWRDGALERFLKYVREDGECWLWTGHVDAKGYGKWLPPEGAPDRAHRFAYTVWVGLVPDDHDVHHICPNKACVRPDHLEALEHGEHARQHMRRRYASV